VETGYEVPFDEPATLLIIKFQGPNEPDRFLTYLEELKKKLEARRESGEPFHISDLPENHPARIFAQGLE